MSNTINDRVNRAVSGAKLSRTQCIRVDPLIVHQCESVGLFIRKGRHNARARGISLSQWIYGHMVNDIKEEMTKGL